MQFREQFEIVTFYLVLLHMHISEHSIVSVDNAKKAESSHTHMVNSSSMELIGMTTSTFSFSSKRTSPPSIYMPEHSSPL